MCNEKTDSNLKHLCIAITDRKIADFRRYLTKAKKSINATVTFSRHSRVYDAVSPLFLAVNTNQEVLVRELLERGANPNACGPRPPLVAAIRSNNETIADLLLAAGAQVNCHDPIDGATPLHAAAQHGNMSLTKKLLDGGANVNALLNTIGTTPLIISVGRGFYDLTKILLAAGADITREVIYDANKPAENALTQAILGIRTARTANSEISQRLNILSALLEATDPIRHEQLLDHSFKIASLDDSSIYYRMLNAFNLRLPQTLLNNLLVQALALQNIEYMQDILKRGADPNTITSTTEAGSKAELFAPVVYIAAQNNNLALVKVLSAHGADPNICASNNESPLFVATIKNHILIVQFLLSLTTIILNQYVLSAPKHPLCGAIIENRIEIIDLLLNHEQLQSMNWKRQNTAILSIAIQSLNTQIIKRFLTAKFSPLETCNFGVSALAIAVCENRAGIVRIILKHMLEARIYKAIFFQEIQSVSKQLLDIAYCYNSKESAQVLIEFGVDAHIALIDDSDKTICQWLNPPPLQIDLKKAAPAETETKAPILTTTQTTIESIPVIPTNYHTSQVTLTYSKRRYLQEEYHLTSDAIDSMLAERNKEKPHRNQHRFFTETHKPDATVFTWFNNTLDSSSTIPIENSINCFMVINSDALYEQDCLDDQLQKFKTIRAKFDDDHIKKLQDDGCVNQGFVINRKVFNVMPTHELRDPASTARLLLYPFLCDKGKATIYAAAKYLPEGLHKQRNIKSLSQQSKPIYLEFKRKSPQLKE